jgi:hypothetical protein
MRTDLPARTPSPSWKPETSDDDRSLVKSSLTQTAHSSPPFQIALLPAHSHSWSS